MVDIDNVDENINSSGSSQQQEQGFFKSLIGVFKKKENDETGIRVSNLIRPGERCNPIGVDIMQYLVYFWGDYKAYNNIERKSIEWKRQD